MSVGNQTSKQIIDNQITGYATELRNVCTQIRQLQTQMAAQGNAEAFLASAGYSTAANSGNPGGLSDAAYAEELINYLGNVMGVYFGTATQPAAFDYDNALSQVWGGQ